MTTEMLIILGAALIGCFGVGYGVKSFFDRKAVKSAQRVKKDAEREAETIIKEAQVSAKEELLQKRNEFENTTKEKEKELDNFEKQLKDREAAIEREREKLDQRENDLQKREDKVAKQTEENENQKEKLSQLISREVSELERIASLDQEQAKEQLLQRLDEQLEHEKGEHIKRFHEEARQRCENEALEIMINAMQRYSNDCASERTTATVPLPSDEMKGRIIGREGRNIRTIENNAGVSVLIDDTPEAVVISCFNPVRKEIARVALERLVSDGRIHPTRIEEMIEKVTNEMEDHLAEIGQDAVEQVGVSSVKENIVNLIGRLKYRYSYSQNVLKHSIEVAHLMGMIAAQVGLDEYTAKRVGLFHDIGKAVDQEAEGTHALIAADVLKRSNEKDEVINAVAAHHEEREMSTPYAVLAEVCDTLSASRPGARNETTELYLKRIEDMETIGNSYEGVDYCYAIQAGRELRVIVQSESVDEDKAWKMARDIAKEVESNLRYPGNVKVSVIRETRAVEYAT